MKKILHIMKTFEALSKYIIFLSNKNLDFFVGNNRGAGHRDLLN